jgi:hypothetical protein
VVLVRLGDAIALPVGGGVDNVVGHVAAEVFYNAAVADSVSEVRGEEVPEVVRRDVLGHSGARLVPSGPLGVLTDDAADLLVGESLSPAAAGADEQEVCWSAASGSSPEACQWTLTLTTEGQ